MQSEKQMTIIESGRLINLIILLFTCISIFVMTNQTKKGKQYEIRNIIAIDAIDELINRAEETNGIVHFTTGGGARGLGTTLTPMLLSGIAILKKVARECAKLDTKLVVHECHADLLPIVQSTIETAYTLENKTVPDETLRYVPSGYSYTSSVGNFLKYGGVKANIMAGAFYHEAIFFAEYGAYGGAMQ
ncbi:unnamed protein product, partial [marine sediment metagenome]